MTRRLAVIAAIFLVASGTAKATGARIDDAVTLTVRPDLGRPGPEFEGWGTALSWFAVVTGGYPDKTRNQLADLLYGKDGLNFTIARYNIGGGNKANTPPYLRPGADVAGFWRAPARISGLDWWRPTDERMWDWSADLNQRWWLDAIRHRVQSPIFEAFSNSPPWFMTVSGRVSGAEKGTDDNLRPGQEGPFAAYLARTVDELQRRHRITFRTLSPINEPNTDYWFAANRQEGAHWSPARQSLMLEAAASALRARGLKTQISAPDETNSHLFLDDWAAYPQKTRAIIGQLNVHSYGAVHQTAVRDIARQSGIRLWMSEADGPLDKDPEDFDGIASALAFGEHVVRDLKRLEPAAWVFWQAVEDISARDGSTGSNWGLIKMDLRAPAGSEHAIHVTPKYWVMAQFSRAIRPGYHLVHVDDMDTAGAISPEGRTLVLVHVNGGVLPRKIAVALRGWSVSATVTDGTRRMQPLAGGSHIVAPPRSVTTLTLKRTGK